MKLSLTNSLFRGVLPLFFLLFSLSCTTGPDISKIDLELNFQRLDEAIFRADSQKEVEQVIAENRESLNAFFSLDQLPDDSVLVRMLWLRSQNAYVDTFFNQYISQFQDLELLKQDVEDRMKYVKYYFPDFIPPKVTILFTALLDKDVFVTQDHAVISLEYFMGPEAKFVPQYPQYMLTRYEIDNIAPMFIGLGVSNFFNQTNHQDASMIAEMIYHGKALYFVSMIDPDISEQVLFGYDENELAYANDQMAEIWSYFIERDLLFSRNFNDLNRYVGERPKTFEIAPDCPGRIGRYLGYQIVKAYMKRNGDSDLESLMSNSDAQEIFRNSSFNPSK